MIISNGYRSFLIHSAKGSTWEDHKYIKRIDGTYYYPDSYEGGRHLPGEKKKNKESSDNDDVISKLEEMTGMKRESLEKLRKLGRENGYNSEEFKDLLDTLSEGDEDQAKRMMNLLKQDDSGVSLSSNDVENLAREVISGNFGNGQIRKDLLGENYQEVQDKVNELLKGKTGSKKISEVSNEVKEEGEKAVKKATNTKTSKTPDLDRVFNVYRNKS